MPPTSDLSPVPPGSPSRLAIVSIGRGITAPDWLVYLLGDLAGERSCVEAWPEPQPHTLYCVDTNWYPLHTFPAAFLDAVRATPGVGLFHSDEWLIEDYSVYRAFSFVLRVHRAAAIAHPGIMTLPLGWPNGGQGTGMGAPASQRVHRWFFAGNLISSRPEMIGAFSRLPGGLDLSYKKGTYDAPITLNFTDYQKTLSDTAIIPAAMGNVVLETWRLYEALENGCIPIVEKRPFLDYYGQLLGKHPIPAFLSWSKAARFAQELLDDPARLDALQADIHQWWTAFKQARRAETQSFVAAGIRDDLRPQLSSFTFPTGRRKTLWQYGELLRHQTGPGILRRLGKALARGSIRRNMTHLDKAE